MPGIEDFLNQATFNTGAGVNPPSPFPNPARRGNALTGQNLPEPVRYGAFAPRRRQALGQQGTINNQGENMPQQKAQKGGFGGWLLERAKELGIPFYALGKLAQAAPVKAAGQAVGQGVGNVVDALPEGAQKALKGRPDDVFTYQKFTPAQQLAQEAVLAQLLAGLQGGAFDFSPFEEKARRDFSQKTLPSIAERFSQLGAQRSSAFPQALSQAGADLEANLAALGSQRGLQQLQLLTEPAFRPSFGSIFMPGTPDILERLAGMAPQLGAMAARGYMGL